MFDVSRLEGKINTTSPSLLQYNFTTRTSAALSFGFSSLHRATEAQRCDGCRFSSGFSPPRGPAVFLFSPRLTARGAPHRYIDSPPLLWAESRPEFEDERGLTSALCFFLGRQERQVSRGRGTNETRERARGTEKEECRVAPEWWRREVSRADRQEICECTHGPS